MSEQHDHQIYVPKEALIAAGSLILLTIVTVAVFRVAGLEPAARISADDRPVAMTELKFEDSPEGAVVIHEISDGRPVRVVQVIESGEGGFIRGVLRSLARSRKASGIGREHPFLLKLQPNGTLLLEDPQTDQRIDLQAFGPTNIESFRALLGSEGAQS
jgi:putative photosynthetic complex assembly protein